MEKCCSIWARDSAEIYGLPASTGSAQPLSKSTRRVARQRKSRICRPTNALSVRQPVEASPGLCPGAPVCLSPTISTKCRLQQIVMRCHMAGVGQQLRLPVRPVANSRYAFPPPTENAPNSAADEMHATCPARAREFALRTVRPLSTDGSPVQGARITATGQAARGVGAVSRAREGAPEAPGGGEKGQPSTWA